MVITEVFIGLCPECSEKLNYKSKKKEVKRLKKKQKIKHDKPESSTEQNSESKESSSDEETQDSGQQKLLQNPWLEPVETSEKTREEEIDDYLTDLLL